ncbi:MAG: YdeI/OmpD-associated family protein [Pseudomonadota bacterium]|nr:YdeI/OmpD-associated family protein [Pseudomonadota bacterium]
MKFKAIIQLNKINPFVLVSGARAKRLKVQWRKPMPVLVQINGEPKAAWKINMMPRGDGSYYLYLHGDVRKASNTKVGDEVDVSLVFDKAYRNGPVHEMPAEFLTQLQAHPKAKIAWSELIPSRQKEILRYFAGLKSETARARNYAKATRVLNGAKERFMARNWNGPSAQDRLKVDVGKG